MRHHKIQSKLRNNVGETSCPILRAAATAIKFSARSRITTINRSLKSIPCRDAGAIPGDDKYAGACAASQLREGHTQ